MGIWGARVLIIEEDLERLEVTVRLLRSVGADVVAVPAAGAALATVIGVTPDVIVIDTTMPGLDALGLLRAIRGLSPEKGGQVPAVVLGECALPAPCPFQGRLAIPFEPTDLVALVEQLAGSAVERRHRALDRRHWPCGVSHERRAEVREGRSETSR